MLLAFVQALVYASELCTLNQLNRLKSWRPDLLAGLDSGQPRCDIFMFFNAANAPLLAQTRQIATNFLNSQDESDGNRTIRRIAFLKTELLDENRVRISRDHLAGT
jgi:hypothetical protein